MRRRIGALIAAGVLLASAPPADATEKNSCVDCHRRPETVRALPEWNQDQFIHWYGSVHGKHNVTCDRCHGGDPARADPKGAHAGVLPSRDPASPVHYKNVPETCRACHPGVYEAFVRSRHFQNLKADRLAPTCTTCHGFEMDIGAVVSPALAGRCGLCHNSRTGIKPGVAEQTRAIVEEMRGVEQALRRAGAAVELAREQGRNPGAAEAGLKEAGARLRKTGEHWHRFRLDNFRQELSEVRKAADEAYAAARESMGGGEKKGSSGP